jgi:hypothetical protein
LFGPRLEQEQRKIKRLERERSAVHKRIAQVCGEEFASRCQGGGTDGNPHGFDYLQDSTEEAFPPFAPSCCSSRSHAFYFEFLCPPNQEVQKFLLQRPSTK